MVRLGRMNGQTKCSRPANHDRTLVLHADWCRSIGGWLGNGVLFRDGDVMNTKAKPDLNAVEAHIRFQARTDWREEGRLDGYKNHPLGSWERSVYLDEAQKIHFADERSQ